MTEFNLRYLLGKMNAHCTKALESATELAYSQNHYEVSIEHLILKLIDYQEEDMFYILSCIEISSSDFKHIIQNYLNEAPKTNTEKPVFSPFLIDWIKDAWLLASINYNFSEIGSEILFFTLISNSKKYLLDKVPFNNLNLKKKKDFLNNIDKEAFKNKNKNHKKIKANNDRQLFNEFNDDSALCKYTTDLTQNARIGNIDSVFGRESEIRQVIDILGRRYKNNPIIVGNAGVGKTALAEGLALRITNGNIPDFLKNARILSLNIGLLMAGASIKGEFENRLKKVIEEYKASPEKIILFIDEAHTIIGAEGTTGSSTAANLLKPALARGELTTIAATTWSEYKKYFEHEEALQRRFQMVKLAEPSKETALLILRGLKKSYEKFHHIVITDEALKSAIDLSSRYLSGRLLPDKAIDLIDTCCAKVKIGLTKKPGVLEDIEKKIQAILREKSAKHNDLINSSMTNCNELSRYDSKIKLFERKHEQLEKKWKKEKMFIQEIITLRESFVPECKLQNDESRKKLKKLLRRLKQLQGNTPLMDVEVNSHVISKVVSKWTGIPIGKLAEDEVDAILQIEKRLESRIEGQSYALNKISSSILKSKAKINHPDKPLGVFLLVGPSGVGKTETSRAVADLLFGGEQFMITINMSEFHGKHMISRLIGSPPGYVGFGEGGKLTEAVRQKPYSVILFDEVEKGDKDVMNIFYQIFDKGVLTDAEGRTVNFKNTIIFITTNLASEKIIDFSASNGEAKHQELIEVITPSLQDYFTPALLARMTIVPYFPLKKKVLKEITKIKLVSLIDRIKENHKISTKYNQHLIDSIVSECIDVKSGARNIEHIIDKKLSNKISYELISGLSKKTKTMTLDFCKKGELVCSLSK